MGTSRPHRALEIGEHITQFMPIFSGIIMALYSHRGRSFLDWMIHDMASHLQAMEKGLGFVLRDGRVGVVCVPDLLRFPP